MDPTKNHFVAVFGGSVSGSEAAFQLASQGFQVVVFDQGTLPYGKIEDGLPLWHVKLRNSEEAKIDKKLSHNNIRFVPNIRLGEDVIFEDVAREWGFSAVLLAIGASIDRPLSVPDVDKFIGNGLIYQNPYMNWINHKHEMDYSGPIFKIQDEAIVIGGGLASIDVVKAVMITTVHEALKQKGIDENFFTLERNLARVLETHSLSLGDLGLKGCTLYYRRRGEDMPLSNLVRDTPEKTKKAEEVTLKILKNAQNKYLFNFEELLAPIKTITGNNDQLIGFEFEKNQVLDGKLISVEGKTETHTGSHVISSIGSLPEKVKGIPTVGSTFKMIDGINCQIEGYENVFAIGNAVTGRGNIKESLQHGKETTINIMEDYLSRIESDFQNYLRGTERNVAEQTENIRDLILKKEKLEPEGFGLIERKVHDLQHKVGFYSSYMDWIEEKRPIRLEELIGHNT